MSGVACGRSWPQVESDTWRGVLTSGALLVFIGEVVAPGRLVEELLGVSPRDSVDAGVKLPYALAVSPLRDRGHREGPGRAGSPTDDLIVNQLPWGRAVAVDTEWLDHGVALIVNDGAGLLVYGAGYVEPDALLRPALVDDYGALLAPPGARAARGAALFLLELVGEEVRHQALDLGDALLDVWHLPLHRLIFIEKGRLCRILDWLLRGGRDEEFGVGEHLEGTDPVHAVDDGIFAGFLQIWQQVFVGELKKAEHLIDGAPGEVALSLVDPLH